MSDLLSLLERPVDALVTIDFETFYDSDFSLSKMTTEAYVRDSRFEVIGVSVKLDDRPSVWMEEAAFRAWAATVPWERVACLAHHAHFDGFILSHHFNIKPGFWVDTLSMARALHGTEVGGSLKKLMVHYGVGEKGEEVHNVKGMRRAHFSAEAYKRYGDYCNNDVEGTYAMFQKMLAAGFPEKEFWLIDTTVRMFTEPSFYADQDLIELVIGDEQRKKAALMERVSADRDVLMSNDKFAVLLAEMGEEPPRKVSLKAKNKDGTPKESWAFAKTDPGFKALLEHPNDEIRWVAEARVGVKSTINETRAERLLGVARRGPVPVYLKYSGAHTHRWSGGDKMNFQNFERTDKTDPSKGRIRKALEAPDGYLLVVADSAQIEARFNAWFAGHEVLVEAFRQNRDVYSEFASEAYGRKIDRKKNAEDEIPGFVGKTAVLGLGYGMGWEKFAGQMLKGGPDGKPIIFGYKEAQAAGADLEAFSNSPKKMLKVHKMASRLPIKERVVHCAVAEAFVNRYRQVNRPIPELWEYMNEVVGWMLEGEEREFGPGGCVRTSRNTLHLPSGLTLRYPGLRFSSDWDDEYKGFSYMGGRGGKERVRVYGGSLTENIIQALARIAVAEQMLWIRTRYHIVTMTHDEVVALAPEAEGKEAAAFMLERMKVPPAWAADVPLKAEGGAAKSYGDAK